MSTIKIGDKLTSDCGGSGLVGEMVVTKIVAADAELDVFNAGDLIYVTEKLNDAGTIHRYETFFNASKLVDGVLTYNNWQWVLNGTGNIYAESTINTDTGEIFPQYIYATPDAWGSETYYMSKTAMEVEIVNLRTLGDDWTGISIDDCSEWSFIDLIERDGKPMAIYACHEGRHPQYARFQPTDGTYQATNFYRNVDDARDDE